MMIKGRRILRVFPRLTRLTPVDEWAFVGEPPLWHPPADQVDEVHVSVVFTWDLPEALRLQQLWHLHYPRVLIGGPACGTPAGDFTPGLYVRPGVTFTTRGCIRICERCFVPRMEGRFRELKTVHAGNVIQDNNLLAASPKHLSKVWRMLRGQKRIQFTGGLDVELMRLEHVRALSRLQGNIREIFLAYDRPQQFHQLAQAIAWLSAAGFHRRKIRVYVLVGFDGDTTAEAEARCEYVWSCGGLPYAMHYRGPEGTRRIGDEWWELCKNWERPGLILSRKRKAGQF